MAEIKTIYKGESVTLLFTFPEAYDMARLASHKIFVGETEFAGVKDGQTIKMQLKSSDTDRMIGTHRIVCLIDDTTLGLRKPYCGELIIAKTQASGSNASVSNISDIIIPIVISETAITVGDVLYNYVKGDKGDPFTYSDFTPEQIAELQQPATDAIASIREVELAVDTAEGLRIQAESNRQTNTATAIQNAETATTNAGNAAILANEKAGLADSKATLADQKATLANDAATLANTKAGLADAAATNANNVANTYAAELALKEVKANKQNSLAVDGTGTKFPTVDAVNAGLGNSGIRALFIARGATYNATTGFYSLNGLTDITEAQMMNIYLNTASQIDNVMMSEMFAGATFRTAYKAKSLKGVFASVSADRSFASNTNLEVFSQDGLYFNKVRNMFSECSNLCTIDFICFSGVTAADSVNMLRGCSSLVYADIRYISNNLSFKDSPLLNYESIRRMVLFKSGTTAITITVHADVFAKLTDQTNYPLWYAEAQNGLAKNITFAT